MDAKFDKIYAEQVDVFRAMQLLPRAVRAVPRADVEVRDRAMRLVDEAIEIALRDLVPNFDVRADARLFLMINLTQMVTIPLLLGSPDLPVAAIHNTLVGDVSRIARAATRYSDGEREISAASMPLGVAEEMHQLRLKEWRLWDRR